MFQYLHFICPTNDLQERLNNRGEEGWRLHTCEPVSLMRGGNSDLFLVVVMDRVVAESSSASEAENAMAMKS